MTTLLHPSDKQKKGLLNGLALLAQIFWGPEPALCRDMVRGSFRSDLEALGPLLDSPGLEDLNRLQVYAQNRTSPEELCRELEEDYLRLFVTAREGIHHPPYQSLYETEEGRLMGRPALMMAKRLEALGVDHRSGTKEPPDHLAVEIEYLFLALEGGLKHGQEGLIALAREFAGEEMLPWVARLAQGLKSDKEAGDFYPAAAGLLVSVLEIVAGREKPPGN